MESCYKMALDFTRKYPRTIAWRLKAHAKVIDEHLNPGEKILYIFVGQKNERVLDIVNTHIIALTNKRIMLGTKRILFGYFFKSITPDLYNDLSIYRGIIWGRVIIDTVKEVVTITNVDARALEEVETNITEIMMETKKEFLKKSTKV